MATAQRAGGSFAPPLTDETLATYRVLIDGVDAKSELREALDVCFNCAAKWWEAPESTGNGKAHASGRGVIIPLDAPIAEQLFDHIPWQKEVTAYGQLFDGLSGPIRNAAYHLLWFAQELTLDREPITADKV